jgi:acylglycerol lipase
MNAMTMKANEEFLDRDNGLRIFVRSWHPPGPPRAVVAICHGVKSHSGYYQWIAEQLVASGLAVYALDLRGRGRSGGERFFVEDVSQYVDDVSALIELAQRREGDLPLFLLGHSAGGVVSSVYTLGHQEELAGFICESFAYQVRHQGHQPDRTAPSRTPVEELGLLARSRCRGLNEHRSAHRRRGAADDNSCRIV